MSEVKESYTLMDKVRNDMEKNPEIYADDVASSKWRRKASNEDTATDKEYEITVSCANCGALNTYYIVKGVSVKAAEIKCLSCECLIA